MRTVLSNIFKAAALITSIGFSASIARADVCLTYSTNIHVVREVNLTISPTGDQVWQVSASQRVPVPVAWCDFPGPLILCTEAGLDCVTAAPKSIVEIIGTDHAPPNPVPIAAMTLEEGVMYGKVYRHTLHPHGCPDYSAPVETAFVLLDGASCRIGAASGPIDLINLPHKTPNIRPIDRGLHLGQED